MLEKGGIPKEADKGLVFRNIANRKSDCSAALQTFVDNGVNINGAGASSGNTALHVAAKRGNASHVTLLLRAKASLFAKNTQNKTPLKVASSKEVQQLLQTRSLQKI